jgi:hypothetical protein
MPPAPPAPAAPNMPLYCNHDLPASLHETPLLSWSKGHRYWSCANFDDPCDFRVWEGAPRCRDGLFCAMKVVKRDGPNQGKFFWCCPMDGDNGCKYFKWVSSATDGEPRNGKKEVKGSPMNKKQTEQLFNQWEEEKEKFGL